MNDRMLILETSEAHAGWGNASVDASVFCY